MHSCFRGQRSNECAYNCMYCDRIGIVRDLLRCDRLYYMYYVWLLLVYFDWRNGLIIACIVIAYYHSMAITKCLNAMLH